MAELFVWLRILNLEFFSTTNSKERQEQYFSFTDKKAGFLWQQLRNKFAVKRDNLTQKTMFRTRRNLEHSFMSKRLRKRLTVERQNARIGLGTINLFLRFLLCYPGQHRKRRKRTTLTTSRCLTEHPFTTLRTRRKLEPTCVPQLHLGSFAGKRRFILFPVPKHSPRILCKSLLNPVSFSFSKTANTQAIEESFRFWDEDDYEYEIFSILSSARAWASVILAGKRDSSRYSTRVGLRPGKG